MWNETAESIVENLEQYFHERGPVSEILMDNATAFKSNVLKTFLERWTVAPYYRAAYRPSGNGIVERHHRTIKAMSERGKVSPIHAVYWYNMSPRSGQSAESVPQLAVHRYAWRQPFVKRSVRGNDDCVSNIEVGDEVWIKPPDSKCTSEWSRGAVTKVNSQCNIEVNGTPRHVLDIRPIMEADSQGSEVVDGMEEESVGEELSQGKRRYPNRDRRPPTWLSDYQPY